MYLNMSNLNDQEFPWQEEFMLAIETNNIENFKELFTGSSGLWREIKVISGNTLLQEAIYQNKREIFKYLLDFCDVEYLEIFNDNGETAITMAIMKDEPFSLYYVPDLVKIYNFIPSHYDRKLLHWSVYMAAFNTAKYLLEIGMDPNTRENENGSTPLHKTILTWYIGNSYDFVALLLFYGADPFLEFQNCNVFEIAVLRKRAPQVHELLFEYTFDKLDAYQIDFKVLLELARLKSPLFHRILECDVEFVLKDVPVSYCDHNIQLLFVLEIDYLKIILEKHYSRVCESFQECWKWDSISGGRMSRSLNFRKFLRKLNMFVESGTILANNIVHFIASITSSWDFFHRVVKLKKPVATQMIFFMSIYSLQIPRLALDLVYKAYGYGDLFKFLLHMDYTESHQKKEDVLIVSIIRDVHKDLDSFLETPEIYSKARLLDVLDFFAHRKLKLFLLRKIQEENLKFPKAALKRLENHPQVPCLVELARNVFRKYLVERFHAESTRRFYSLVGNLHISSTHKKIINCEMKLY